MHSAYFGVLLVKRLCYSFDWLYHTDFFLNSLSRAVDHANGSETALSRCLKRGSAPQLKYHEFNRHRLEHGRPCLLDTLHFDIFRFGHLRKATQLHEELWLCHSLPRQHCWVVMKPQSARFRCCTTCVFYILRMNLRRTSPSLNPNYLLDMAQWRLICFQCLFFLFVFFVKWETWTQQQLWRNVRSFWSRGGCAGTIFSVKRADLWLEQMLTVYLIRYQTLQNTQKKKKKVYERPWQSCWLPAREILHSLYFSSSVHIAVLSALVSLTFPVFYSRR